MSAAIASPTLRTAADKAAFVECLEPVDSFMTKIELARLSATRPLASAHRSQLGQFLTPSRVAEFMAGMFGPQKGVVRLLDAGAGIGTLSAAFIEALCSKGKRRPTEIQITAYEIEPTLVSGFTDTMSMCEDRCRRHGIRLGWRVLKEDFVEAGAQMLGGGLFDQRTPDVYDCAILNPPYRKIRSDSRERYLLRSVGIETSNLYTAFLAIAVGLLRAGGEMVAITPRSFCNGPYFKPFRHLLLDSMSLDRVHVYRSRRDAFQSDQVLQENIVFHGSKQKSQSRKVIVSSNRGPDDPDLTWLELERDDLVNPTDPDVFIRVLTSELERRIARRMSCLTHKLDELGISVSTGRVVDFRAREYLRRRPGAKAAPLIYPGHFEGGFVEWPNVEDKKPNALLRCRDTEDLLVTSDFYVLTKRFSTKEERRRLVAAVFDPERIPQEPTAHHRIGFENHLNYFHRNGGGLPPVLAKGLAAYLNSTLVDSFFRQFNGHTQVNATDLRSLSYPSLAELEELGKSIDGRFPVQEELDLLIDRVLNLSDKELEVPDPVSAKNKLEEALTVLKEMDLPKAQQNERSALTLLALLDLAPEDNWEQASNPLRGITQLMTFMAEKYGRTYAPNTRETVRKDSVHHFVQAGLAVKNPDDPARPTNSPNTVYQVSPYALSLLRSFGSTSWPAQLKRFSTSSPSLRSQYAKERRMERIPLRLPGGESLTLSPGGQSRLVKQVLDDFCPLFAAGAELVYIGDTAKKWAFLEDRILQKIGVEISEHGKMPDVVVFQRDRNWLFLIEAVSSRGPMDAKRQIELRELFLGSSAELVFVTAFPDRATMARHLPTIAWDTEVWIAETPTHLIHFDGERFLGPYQRRTDR